MAKIVWDETGKKLYETGVRNGVFYPQNSDGTYPRGIAWNGLISVSESPSGAEPTPIYADDGKYLTLLSAEEFGATVEAYTYPDEFAICDGTAQLVEGINVGQQARSPFGLVYRTSVGNDTDGISYGYKLHLIYGALASPSEKSYQTINDSPEAITFSWELSTTPVAVPDLKPTASIIIDSTKVNPEKLAVIEGILFGTQHADARLPLPAEIKSIMDGSAPQALQVSTISPTDGAGSAAVAGNIVITFNNKILEDSVTLMKQDGTVVKCNKSYDPTGKILTLDPQASLAVSTKHIVVIAGVCDIYNQSLDTVTKSFTTAGE